MKAELDRIPMRTYIDLQTGDCTEDFGMPMEQARHKLRIAYLSIVAGRKIGFEIARQNELYNYNITIQCLHASGILLALGKEKEAREIMKQVGYDTTGNTTEQVAERIERAASMAKLKMDRMLIRKKEKEDGRNEEEEQTREQLINRYTQERVAMMAHYKMYIDIEKMTAAEYAHLLKRMCDQIEKENKVMT